MRLHRAYLQVYIKDALPLICDCIFRRLSMLVPSRSDCCFLFLLLMQKYLIRDLTCLVEEKLGKLNDAQFLLRKTVVEEACHGKKFTIGDYGIKTGDTLVLARIGLVLNINNPQVGNEYKIIMALTCTSTCPQLWLESLS